MPIIENNNTEQTSSRTLEKLVGALLMAAGGGMLLYLLPELYHFLQSPHETSFIKAIMSQNLKGFFIDTSTHDNVKVEFSCITYPLALFLNVITLAVIAGVAKTLIVSGVQLFGKTKQVS